MYFHICNGVDCWHKSQAGWWTATTKKKPKKPRPQPRPRPKPKGY